MLEKKKYNVTLTDDEKELLYAIINKGKHGARKRKQAQALLLTDAGYTDEVIAERTGMYYRYCTQFIEPPCTERYTWECGGTIAQIE
jgi:hypothetical protein